MKLLDRATSELLVEPDWETILLICDQICQDDITPKVIVQALIKKMNDLNRNVIFFSLFVLEAIVKNCGPKVHQEIATKDFMSELEKVLNKSLYRYDKVNQKILNLVQSWTKVFPQYPAVQNFYATLQSEKYVFPEGEVESENLFKSYSTPRWIDGENCSSCQSSFTFMNRKHHCRSCGDIFCTKCSSKKSILPKFGIEKEVRVCEACFKSNRENKGYSKNNNDMTSTNENLPDSIAKMSKKTELSIKENMLKEQEELELALAISASEAESNLRSNVKSQYPKLEDQYLGVAATYPEENFVEKSVNTFFSNQKNDSSAQKVVKPIVETITPSAPLANIENDAIKQKSESLSYETISEISSEQEENNNSLEEFMQALNNGISIFTKRMLSNSYRSRPISNDSSVQSLFLTLNHLQPKLLLKISDQESARSSYERMQDKLSQIRDAREALNALRQDYFENCRRAALQAEQAKQEAMQRKLADMRLRKQEYLDYQRQLSIQRLQQHQADMQARIHAQTIQHQQQAVSHVPSSSNVLSKSMNISNTVKPQQPYAVDYNSSVLQSSQVPLSSDPFDLSKMTQYLPPQYPNQIQESEKLDMFNLQESRPTPLVQSFVQQSNNQITNSTQVNRPDSPPPLITFD